jgi:outer membrane protein OmpU
MRKLLLTTTALVAAGAISSAALADGPSISGDFKWSFDQRDSGINVTGESGDRMYTEQNVTLSWVNKTDSGLEISMHKTLNNENAGGRSSTTADDTVNNDESAIKIKGGFGTIQLGNDDGAGDQLTRTAHDILGTPDALHGDLPSFHRAKATSGTTGNLGDDNADLPSDIDDEANITYILPKMGGLTVGVSYRDAGSAATENADETEFAGKFEFAAGEVSGALHYGQHSQDGGSVGDQSLDASSMAIDLTMGNIRAVYAQAKKDVAAPTASNAPFETEITDFGINYKINDGLNVAVVMTEVDENIGGETLDVTTVGASYTIASGLTAHLTYHDYDYKAGTSGETNDDGSNTTLSIVAKF